MKTKKRMISFLVFLMLGWLLINPVDAQNNPKNILLGPQPDGSILVPSNQLLRPAGFQVEFPGRPVDLVQAMNKRVLVAMNRSSLEVIRINDRMHIQSLALVKSSCSFTGLSVSKDGRTIFVPDSRNKIHIAEFDDNLLLSWKGTLQLPAPLIGGNPVPGGPALNEAETVIYVPLSRSNTLALIDRKDQSVREIPVGIAPYEVVLVSDLKAYVSNWGGRVPNAGESTFNTSGSQVLVDPITGIANSGTVSVIDLATNIRILDIEVGLHPSGMVLSPDHSLLYVACANSDQISVIDTRSDKVTRTISVRMQKDLPFGSSPNALAISGDGKFLYVANGTDNAICVIDTGTNEILGCIPTGWYPGSVILDEKARLLFVANVKGIGSRNQLTNRAGFNSHDHSGTLSVIPVPDIQKLAVLTKQVRDNNSFVHNLMAANTIGNSKSVVPVPQVSGQKSPFKHVVYIIKENRTYDQVFGDMPQGNGDPGLVLFGKEVTPNHHKLAETFVLLDNFYCSGVLSADGHQWTDEAYVTDYIEKFFGDFSRSYPYDGNDALAYASSGFIWDNVLRNGLTFRDYGEFVDAWIEPANSKFADIYQDFIDGNGQIKIRAKANLQQLEPYLCPSYVGFPNTVPDVYRAAEFIRELKEFEKQGDFPNFTIMLLPNDHTSGTSPGMPVPTAAVADNDLALGQIVEALSNSKFWKEMCIFVTEDDPQAGLDHVDGHRTVGMVISPYTKRNQVVSTYYSQINMVRTMENILGLPPMNQLDLAAEPMTDCFTEKPDFGTYKALPNNVPLDKLNPPLMGLVGKQRYWAEKSLEQDLDDVDRIDEDTFNRIIWHAVKGYDVPYPVLSAGKSLHP